VGTYAPGSTHEKHFQHTNFYVTWGCGAELWTIWAYALLVVPCIPFWWYRSRKTRNKHWGLLVTSLKNATHPDKLLHKWDHLGAGLVSTPRPRLLYLVTLLTLPLL